MPNQVVYNSLSSGRHPFEYFVDVDSGAYVNHVQFNSAIGIQPASPRVIGNGTLVKLQEMPEQNIGSALSIDLSWQTDYTMPNKSAVMTFLESHPYLESILHEAPQSIAPYFGDAELVLRVNDESDYSDTGELNLFIHTTMSAREAASRLDALRCAWLLGKPSNVQDTFFVSVQRLPA